MRPSLFFDTNVSENVRNGSLSASEWTSIRDYVAENCEYCVSLNTLYELAVPLAKGSAEYFAKHQARIAILYEPGNPRMLGLVGDFLRQHVFSLPARRTDFSPDHLSKWGPVLLRARSKEELTSGGVTLVDPETDELSYGFRAQMASDHVDDGKAFHASRMHSARTDETRPATHEEWAVVMLSQIDVPITPQNSSQLMAATTAAYCFDQSLRKEVKNVSYPIEKRASDWLDVQQLLYLADSHLFLITDDGAMRRRVAGAAQGNQVIDLEDFRAIVRAGQALRATTPAPVP